MTLYSIHGRDELLAVRFACSPAWETLAAVRTFVDERSRSYHQPWHRLVRDRIKQLDLGSLLATQPLHGSVPDFLTPPPRLPWPRLRDQLAEIRATPPDQVAHELALCRETVSEQAGRGALDRLIADPSRLRHVLDQLDPRIRWTGRGIEIADSHDARVSVDERGLVLMPSAYVWPYVITVVDEPWQPTLIYPARGIADLWQAPPSPSEALARLLGRTRALVLKSLGGPLSTTALAGLIELSPAGVSRHLLVLRDAGLISATRHGHELRYARTALGSALSERTD